MLCCLYGALLGTSASGVSVLQVQLMVVKIVSFILFYFILFCVGCVGLASQQRKTRVSPASQYDTFCAEWYQSHSFLQYTPVLSMLDIPHEISCSRSRSCMHGICP